MVAWRCGCAPRSCGSLRVCVNSKKFGLLIILFRAFLLPMASFAENVQENIDVYL